MGKLPRAAWEGFQVGGFQGLEVERAGPARGCPFASRYGKHRIDLVNSPRDLTPHPHPIAPGSDPEVPGVRQLHRRTNVNLY
jgi:hypothetical protein